MRKIGIIATLLCACALSFALVGCGGGSGSSSEGDAEAAKAAFAGTWDLVGMVQDGQETSKDDIEMLKALGLEVYLNLNDDGTSELALFGESMTGTWEASSETEGTITMEGDAVGMTIDGENLKMVDGESSLTFAKGEARSAAAASTDAASTDAADADADAELGDTELGDSELGDSELGDSELGEDSEEESSEQA